VSDTLLVRRRLSVDDRTFTVLAEPWYDGATTEWKVRLLFLPLDRSLPRAASTGAVKRSRRRDDLLRLLERLEDREVVRAFRGLPR